MPAPDPGPRGEAVIAGPPASGRPARRAARLAGASTEAGIPPRSLQWWELIPALLVAAICVIGIVQALRFTDIDDLGLAYAGGQEAWASGHPEHVWTWISTPFLGMAMAIVSRVLSVTTATML